MSGELRLYDVIVGGHKTQMRLNDADAAALQGVLVGHPDEHPVSASPTAPDAGEKVRLVTSNKMRGTDEPAEHHEREAR